MEKGKKPDRRSPDKLRVNCCGEDLCSYCVRAHNLQSALSVSTLFVRLFIYFFCCFIIWTIVQHSFSRRKVGRRHLLRATEEFHPVTFAHKMGVEIAGDRSLHLGDTAEIRFLGRDTVFCWSAVHLNKTTKCLQLLHDFRSESYRQSKRYKT